MTADPDPSDPDTILLDDLPCRHAELLREIARRLERIGGPAACAAMEKLAASAESHADLVEQTIAFIEALEAAPTAH